MEMWNIQAILIIFFSVCKGITFIYPPSCGQYNLQLTLERDLRFLFIGESANMTCTINTGNITNFSINDFNFIVKKNGRIYNISSQVSKNSTHVEMSTSDLIEDAPEQTFFDYVCQYQGEDEVCLERTIIYSDFRPTPVKHFYCIVTNWENLACWFDFGVKYKNNTWNKLTVYTGMLYQSNSTVDNRYIKFNGTCVEIKFPKESFSLAQTFVDIILTNKIRNVFEHSGTFVFDPVIYVKPDPIIKFTAERNATKIRLVWFHSNNSMKKKFRIQYRSEYDDDNYWMLHDIKGYNMILSNLTPYTMYYIKIDVRPIFDNGSETGYWSETFKTSHKTKEDVPSAVPKFWPGYFSPTEDGIEIYWKPIDVKERCGIIQSYRVTMQEVLPFGKIENTTTETFPPDRVSYKIQLELQKKYKIKLTQRTNVGYPIKDDSHIDVFPNEYRPKLSSLYNVEALNDSLVVITWGPASLDGVNEEIKELSVYQIVWCNGTFQDKCLGPIESKVIPFDKPEVQNITMSLEGHYTDYNFGISAVAETRKGLFISSGIIWYKGCVYLRDGISIKALDLTFPLDKDQENGLYFEWTPYNCHESVGKVESYIIKSCITDKQGVSCQEKEERITVPSSSTNYTLKDLTVDKLYLVKIAPILNNGRIGQWSNSKPVLFAGKTAKAVVNETQNLVWGAVIGGGIAIICLSVAAILFIRRGCKKVEDDVREINTPVIKKSHLDNMEAHSSGSDTRESHLPLLKNNHTTNDSGFGGSTLNTNGNSTEPNSLDKNKKYSIQNGGIVQNGVIGNHEKHLQQNGSVVSYPVINESTDISTNNEELQVHSETSFISVGMSGDSELNSGYTDMDMHTSDEDSSSSVQSSNFSNSFSNKKTPKLIISDPSVRGDQKTKESSYIDSYCEQGESSYNIES